MDISSMHRASAKRFRGPRMDRHVRPPNGRKHTQRIMCRLREGGVAVDGADAEEM